MKLSDELGSLVASWDELYKIVPDALSNEDVGILGILHTVLGATGEPNPHTLTGLAKLMRAFGGQRLDRLERLDLLAGNLEIAPVRSDDYGDGDGGGRLF